jgi:transposase
MKHHYEIMRIMRTKIPSIHELLEGVGGIAFIRDAIAYRIEDLTRVSVSSSTACYAKLVRRELFSAETRTRETVRKLRFWDCGLFIISLTVRSNDVLAPSLDITRI